MSSLEVSSSSSPLDKSLPQSGGLRSAKLAIDIDDTLSLTAHYWAELLYSRYPVSGTTVKELIQNHRRASLVPHWQHQDALQLFQELRASASVSLAYDPVPGALQAITKLAQKIEIEYLTMRPRSLRAATAEWLESHGFPTAEIVACPDSIEYAQRAQWKADHLHNEFPSLIGIVEDDERVALALPSDYRGTLFLFSHESTPRQDISVVACADWHHVHLAVERVVERERTR